MIASPNKNYLPPPRFVYTLGSLPLYIQEDMLLNNIVIVPEIRHKLETKHQVREIEVHQCFLNRDGPYIEDTEEEHETESGYPTEWFIAETDKGRLLKVCFVCENGNVYVKSAFDANQKSLDIYEEKRAEAGQQ